MPPDVEERLQDPARHQRLFEVFDAVADLPDDEQPAAVRALCTGDPSLADQVMGLLGHDRSQTQPLTGTEGLLPMAAELLTHIDIPDTLGSYSVIRKLGAGGMGVVFEAEQAVPRRRVALKVVHPWLRSTRAEELLREEVQSMAEVLHPGIPQVYQVFSVEDTTVVAMELVEGRPLDEAWHDLDRSGRFKALLQIADAVQAAHLVGVVHRDLKPGNIKVLPGGQPKVLDFGIASRPDHQGMSGAGTAAYAAPEQRSGQGYDGRVDVFALGVSMAELILGARPPRGDDGRVVLPDGVIGDPALDAIIRKATALDPAQRYPRMAELQRDLWAARYLRPVKAMGWSPGRWTRDWAIRNRLALGAVVGVVGVIGLLGAGVFAGNALRFFAWQTARARAMLEDLERQPLDTPEERAQAMSAFTRDAALWDTPHVSDAWSLIADKASSNAERRAALARAWSTARQPPQVARTASALAEFLVRDDRWDAVRLLREDLPPGPAPAFDLYLALEDGDLGAARAVMTPAQRRILPILEEVVVDDFDMSSGWPVVLDGARWAVDDPATATRLFPDGTTGPSTIITDAPGVPAGPAIVRFLEQRWGWPAPEDGARRDVASVHFGDADDDGVLERYDLGYYGRLPLAVSQAGADASPTPILPWLTTDSNVARSLELVDLDGDGGKEALVTFRGWTYSGVVVLTGLPDAPRILDLVQARRASACALRTRSGPAFLIVGSEPERPFRAPDEQIVSSVHIGRVQDGRVRLSAPIDHFHGSVRKVQAADLDGDGLDEVILRQDRGSWILLHEEAGWTRIPLPSLELLEVGDFDGDGRSEIWARRGRTSLVLGASGGPPLPAASRPPRRQVRPAPDGTTTRFRSLWNRAEALAALGMLPEAVTLYEDMAQLPGPTREQAIHRAIQWLQTVEVEPSAGQPGDLIHRRGELGARLATALGEGERSAPDDLVDALHRDHRFDALHALGRSADHGPWEPVITGHAVAESARLDPLAVRVRPARDDVLLAITGDALADVVSIPLTVSGPVVSVRGELDLVAQDFSHSMAVSLHIDGQPVGFRLGRYGGGPPDNHSLGMRCGTEGHGTARPWRRGRYPFEISIDLAEGTLRCTLGSQALTVPLPIRPSSDRVTLGIGRIRQNGSFAQTQARLLALEVRGASVDEGEPDRVYRAIHGERAATAALRSGPTLEDRVAGAFLARDPAAVDLRELPETTRWTLLRRDPSVWGPELLRKRGSDGFAQDFVVAYAHQLQRMEDELREVLDPLDMHQIPLDSAAAWRIHRARAQTDLDRGRLLQAEQALAELSASPHGVGAEIGDVWVRLARRRLVEGDRDKAALALEEAVRRSTQPLPVLVKLWEDPELAALAPMPPGPRTTGRETAPP